MILEPPAWIANILEQHVEDLGALWAQRLTNSDAENYTRRSLTRLDARILAHVDALVLAGDEALPMLMPALTADYGGALTAGMVLRLAGGAGATAQLLAAFRAAGGSALDGLAQALAWTTLQTLKDPLTALAKEGTSPQSIAAMGILAAHDNLRPMEILLDGLVAHAEPAVRLSAWRAIMNLAAPRPPMTYQRGTSDSDPALRIEALWAAAWAGQKTIIPQLRAAAQKPTPASIPLLHLFAVLAQAEDTALFVNLAGVEALGPARFEIMGRSGFPAVAPALITAMKGKDAASAASAAHAFTCLTNSDPTSGARVSLGAPSDPVDAAFVPEVQVPEPAIAEAHWKEHGPSLSALPRISRGVPVDPATAPIAANLPIDCRGYLDVHLRHYFNVGSPKRRGDFLRFSTTPA